MELWLYRQYHANGTNGELWLADHRLCFTIELPWHFNHPNVSCVPEGRYLLKQRYSPKFHAHLHLTDVPGRSLILMHPANDALMELRGCIAPVSRLTGEGTGDASRAALQIVLRTLENAFRQKESNFITILSGFAAMEQKAIHEKPDPAGESPHPGFFQETA
jgi:hypothetical protein